MRLSPSFVFHRRHASSAQEGKTHASDDDQIWMRRIEVSELEGVRQAKQWV
jgi:hypothetical protein